MLLYVEYNIIFVSVVCIVVDSVSSKQQQWNLNRSSTEVHWLCWMCAVRSLWLHRLPDQPQAHDFFSKQRLLVRSMWNYVESDQGQRFLTAKFSYVYIRIRAYGKYWNGASQNNQNISAMKRFGTSEQQLHVEVYPQEKLHPQFRKSTVKW